MRDGPEVLHLKDLGVYIIRNGVPLFLRKAGAKDGLRGDAKTDGKAAASCRTPNKKRQRLPLLQASHTLT
jgi:hypothetical protein